MCGGDIHKIFYKSHNGLTHKICYKFYPQLTDPQSVHLCKSGSQVKSQPSGSSKVLNDLQALLQNVKVLPQNNPRVEQSVQTGVSTCMRLCSEFTLVSYFVIPTIIAAPTLDSGVHDCSMASRQLSLSLCPSPPEMTLCG